MMRPDDYAGLGDGLYYNYYCQSDNEIGYYMSLNFVAMAELTRECFAELQSENKPSALS